LEGIYPDHAQMEKWEPAQIDKGALIVNNINSN